MNQLEVALQKSLSPDNLERRGAEAYLDNASSAPDFIDALLSLLTSDVSVAFPALAYLKQKGEYGSASDIRKIINSLVYFLELPCSIPRPTVRLAASTISRCARELENRCTDDDNGEGASGMEPVVEYFNTAQNCILTVLRKIGAPDSEQNNILRLRVCFLVQELMQDLSPNSFLRQNIVSEVVRPMFDWMMAPSLKENVCNSIIGEVFSTGIDVLRVSYEGDVPKELQEAFSRYFLRMVELSLCSTCTLFAHIQEWDARQRILQLGIFVVEVLQRNRWSQKMIDASVIRSVIQTLFEDVEYFTSLLDVGEEPSECTEESALFFVRRHNASRWSFLNAVATSKGNPCLPHVFTSEEDVFQFCRVMLEYSCLSQEEAAVLVLEPSEFFRGEEERLADSPVALRDYVSTACVRYAKQLGAPFTKVALETFISVLLCEPDGPELGRDREASMFLLQCVISEGRGRIFTEPGIKDTVFPMLLRSMSQIIHCDAIRGSPIHVARALVLLPLLLMTFSAAGENTEPIRRELVSLALNALRQLSSSQQMLVKVSACKFIFSTIPLCLEEDLSSIISQGIEPLFLMMQEPSLTDDCLYTVLETVAVLIKTHRRKRSFSSNTNNHNSATSLSEVPHGLYEPLFACWRVRLVDPNVGDLIRDIFRELLLSVPEDTSVLTPVEWMRGMLSATGEELCVVPTIIGMLTDLFHHGSGYVAQGAVHIVLDSLAHFILSMDFTAVFSASLKCLTLLLRRCQPGEAIAVSVPPQLIVAYCEETRSATEHSLPTASYPLTTVLTAMLLRILDPQVNEVALFNVKAPLTQLVERIHDFSNHETIKIVNAVTSRLHTVKTGTVTQQLLVPLALLFEHHRIALLNVWCESNQLLEVFSLWLGHLPHFSGVRDVVGCTRSLLLALQDNEACSRFALCVLQNWTPASHQEAGVRAWEAKNKRRKNEGGRPRSQAPAAISISLDAAVFVTVGKSLITLSKQWEEYEALSISGSSEDGSSASLFREDESDEEDTDIEEGEEQTALWERKVDAKRQEMLQYMRETFSCMKELGNRYGGVATPLFSSEELSTITSFLAILQSPSDPLA